LRLLVDAVRILASCVKRGFAAVEDGLPAEKWELYFPHFASPASQLSPFGPVVYAQTLLPCRLEGLRARHQSSSDERRSKMLNQQSKKAAEPAQAGTEPT
jgi:hypothetical protein